MSSLVAQERAVAVLRALQLTPGTRAASGRYQRSLPIRPGVRYWSTSKPRMRQDLLGVQFNGAEGVREGEQ